MSLADQLLRAGIISEKRYSHHTVERQIEMSQSEKREIKALSLTNGDLDSCQSMAEFKQIAKKILQGDPSQIVTIIQKAHRFKDDDDPVAKKFIWFFYELRDQIRGRDSSKQAELLRRAFRRHGPTFDEVEEAK